MYTCRLILEIMANSVTSKLQDPSANYNYFFNPDICHVCKSKDSKLKLCVDCRMISYCSDKHRSLHREEHEGICNAIKCISKQRNILNTRDVTPKEWVEFQKANIQAVRDALHRELEPYEQQIFFFAKSCYICHKQVDLITTCESCKSISICSDHLGTPKKHNCWELRVCLNQEISSALMPKQERSCPRELLIANINLYSDMRSLIQQSRRRDHNTWSIDDYINSEKLSGPLTIYFGMLQTKLLQHVRSVRTFKVHIIAGSYFDIDSLSAWEIILHALPSYSVLIIVVIGPNIPGKSVTMPICKICLFACKTFLCEYCPMLYTNFILTRRARPDAIILFHTQFSNNEISFSVKALQQAGCLIYLTTKSASETQKIMMKIREEVGISIMPFIIENNFASCRSHRDVESSSVFFMNRYLIIYRDLNTPKNLFQAGTSTSQYFYRHS